MGTLVFPPQFGSGSRGSGISPCCSSVEPTPAHKFLGGLNYPAGKDGIVECAKQQGADENVMDVLRKIPNRQYDGRSQRGLTVN
jgi:hypothetical protein